MTDPERIADLENQLETWKVIHRTDQERIRELEEISKNQTDTIKDIIEKALSKSTQDEEIYELQSMWEAYSE